MEINYFLCSSDAIERIKFFDVSKRLKWFDSYVCVAHIDYEAASQYYHENEKQLEENNINFWLREITESQVNLSEIEFTLDDIKEHGIFRWIEYHTGLTSGKNVAYCINAIANDLELTPIELFNKLFEKPLNVNDMLESKTNLEKLDILLLDARKDKNKEIQKNLYLTLKGELENAMKSSDDDANTLISKIAKKMTKSVEQVRYSSEYESVVQEATIELDALKTFLPKELTDEEVLIELRTLGLDKMNNFGQKMGAAMKLLKGKVDGNRVKQLLNQL